MVTTVSTLTSGIENSTNGLERLTMTVQEKFVKYKDDLNALTETMDKYRYLLDQGDNSSKLPDEFKLDSFKVPGCMSNVWLVPKHNDNTIDFMGYSDAAFTNGLVAIIVNIFSGATTQEIRDTDTSKMIEGLQLPNILTPSRRNGAFNMFKKIKDYAR